MHARARTHTHAHSQVVELDDRQTQDECRNGFLWERITLWMKQASPSYMIFLFCFYAIS